ncbi:hypothetical protein Tco_1411943 [Tanacetum coccineum]
MIIEKRLAFFKELNHRGDDNAMVVLDNCNDVPEESVKDNDVSNEKDDVTEKQKDVENIFELDGKNTVQEFNRDVDKPEDVEKVVDQDVDKPEDVEKESEFGNNELVNDGCMNTECENHNDSGKKELEKNTEDLIKGTIVCVEISKKEVSKGVLAINEDPLKGSQSETSIFDNCETLEEADFPSIGLEDIESLKGGRRNFLDEKSTVQNMDEDDMILQDSLLNIPFLSTQEVTCLEIFTQKSPQIQKQEIPKSFHSNKLKLGKYVLPDAQATGEKRQEVMVTETLIFRGKETKTFDSIKSKLVKKNDGMAECMKEKPIHELKGKSVDFKGGHPTVKRQQIKKQWKERKMFQRRVETKAKTVKPAPTKQKKKEPNDKEETAIHASPISFIPPPIDTESEKRQGKPSNF